jgi:hypothetical protein
MERSKKRKKRDSKTFYNKFTDYIFISFIYRKILAIIATCQIGWMILLDSNHDIELNLNTQERDVLTATAERQAHRGRLSAGKSTGVVGGDLSGVSGISQITVRVHRIAVRLVGERGRLGARTSTSGETHVSRQGPGNAKVGRASDSRSNRNRDQRHFMK